jgi:NAD(P)H dehydrogenase (quinone)
MTSRAPIAITGATGAVGGRVAARLAAHGVPLRLVVRDPSRAPRLDRAEVVRATYDEPAAMQQAFAGAHTLFFVSAAEHPDRVGQHLAVVDAAASAGVEHVVYTSFLGASVEATFTLARHHWLTEQHLRGSGMGTTFLRDSLYLDFVPLMVGADGVIRGPAGEGRVAAVARDDVADVAVAVLRDPGAHAGQTYDLTGPDLLSFADVAGQASSLVGRDIRFVDETEEQAWESRRTYGAPDWIVEGWVSTYLAVRAGELAVRTGHVEALSGHPPIGLRALIGRDPQLLAALRSG